MSYFASLTDVLLLLGGFACAAMSGHSASGHGATWKAGIAKAVITPQKPLWLAGYGNRERPSEGKRHDLWIKALALEDANGQLGVLVTSDLMGFAPVTYEAICTQLQHKFGLKPAQIMLTFSHTHCGPVQRETLLDYYQMTDQEWQDVEEYSLWLEARIVDIVGQALSRRVPVTLSASEGTATFAVNRRNNREAEVAQLLEAGTPLKGPVDHSVPVLSVRTPDGQLLALVFGYACHTTTLNDYQWCGDYAGYAQIALEQSHPGAQAMFWTGCGGDQNPLPRRKVELCEQYGRMLAAGVEEALQQPMRPIAPALRMAFTRVSLPYEANPTRQELEAWLATDSHVRRHWAKRMLQKLEAGQHFEPAYAYGVQVWRLGAEQLLIALGAEAVVDYSLRFKREFGAHTWVCGYAHDMAAYIPSRRVWEEGGYEGGYLWECGFPAERWAGDVEDRVAAGVHRLVQEVQK